MDFPDLSVHLSTCGLTVSFLAPLRIFQIMHVDFTVEMADVADDGLVLHLLHLPARDDVAAARRGDEDIALGDAFIQGGDFIAFHGRLQGADRVDLDDGHPGAESPHGLGASLADVSISADDHRLAGNHDVRRPFDAVGQGFAAAVEIVELRFRHRIVDVDRRKEQFPCFFHLIEPVNARRRLFGNPENASGNLLPVARRCF